MVGFIAGIPIKVCIHGYDISLAEIDFLCVKKEFRNKRLAPLLIREVSRRIHMRDQWWAVYTSGTMLPKPFAETTYYHRNLNVKKLVDIHFTYLPHNMNLARAKNLYKLPTELPFSGFRPMEEKDVEQVYVLLENFEKQFKVHGYYDRDQVKHWFIPRKNVVYSYVREDGLALTDRYVLSIKNKPAQHMSYIEASEKGYADAQFFRAIYCFRKGENEEGRKWLDKAVQQGLAVAQHMMGSIYRNGWYGVEKNKGLAFLNESMAAQKGNIPAQMELGLAYGLADQYKDAVEWLRKAAESGNSEAHIYLGMCYEEGLGVERDYNEALKLYDWSFERDHNKTASEAYRRVIEKMKQ